MLHMRTKRGDWLHVEHELTVVIVDVVYGMQLKNL